MDGRCLTSSPAAVTSSNRISIQSQVIAFALFPSEQARYDFLEKLGNALEGGTKALGSIGKAIQMLPPISIGIGFGTGCGIGLGWTFGQVKNEGLQSPPRYFTGCGAGIGVGIGIGQGFGRHITPDRRPEQFRAKSVQQIEEELRRFITKGEDWIKSTFNQTGR